jgi:xylan 1,4-beta-xylosidase
VDDHVRMNLPNHLRTIDRGCAIIASYPELKGVPVIIGESDPDGCAACSSEFYPQNDYRNGAQYASYTAATFMRKQAIAERHGVKLEGAVTWAFAFESQPWFAGFRTLATHGIAKPVFNAFRMFSLLEEKRVTVENSARRSLGELMRPEARATMDIDAMATRGGQALSVVVWHYHDDGVPGPVVDVNLTVKGLPQDIRRMRLSHYRIDEHHSNAYTLWQSMGSVQNPTSEQYAALQEASQLALFEPVRRVDISDGEFSVQLGLPRHAVSLVRLEW